MDQATKCYRQFLAGDENGLVQLIRDYRDGRVTCLLTKHSRNGNKLAE